MCPISGIVRVLISLLWSLREISLSYLYVSDLWNSRIYVSDLWNSRFYFLIPTFDTSTHRNFKGQIFCIQISNYIERQAQQL